MEDASEHFEGVLKHVKKEQWERANKDCSIGCTQIPSCRSCTSGSILGFLVAAGKYIIDPNQAPRK
ncbi:hypothetical protein SLEP1_g57803 [Rubroshorea leprosula]|uniref:Uncharacterized protein n=1 Tax=Rubroshorea leprosula TaxID=152421 RepID=A0AAV5MQ61_9ROSI|nr:hypothetical protein SLEP1_g57803 [Rubroshorea leprosula]